MLQPIAVCSSALQRKVFRCGVLHMLYAFGANQELNETHGNTLQHIALHCNTLQHIATHCDTLQHAAARCNTLQRTATLCNTPQHSATHYDTLEHAAAHFKILHYNTTPCNTLQRTASHNSLHRTETRCKILHPPQHTAIHSNTPQLTPTHCNCNAPQQTAT